MSVKAIRMGNGSGSFSSAIFPGTSQKVAFSATNAQSTALGASTTLVELYASQNCHIKVAADPTAVADGTCLFLPLGVVRQIAVTAGHKIGVIRDSADGNLFITEATSI